MKTFFEWLESSYPMGYSYPEDDSPEIKGEYWIIDGSVEFADGDIGDFNHEAIAYQHIEYQFKDKIRKLAEELGIEEEKTHYGTSIHDNDEFPQMAKLLERIREHLNNDTYIQRKIGANNDVFSILLGSGQAKEYVVLHEGWIEVRGNNIALYNYAKQRKSLASGLGEIIEQEMHEEFDETKMEFDIHDYKSGKSFPVTLAEIENKKPILQTKPIIMPQKGKGDRRFTKIMPDSAEKYSQYTFNFDPVPSKPPITQQGNELWRGTSESFDVNNKLLLNMEPWDFDQSKNGWRSLPSLIEKENIIKQYIFKNSKNGIFTRNQNKYLDITTLYFHLGQILAMQNKIGEAIPWFYKSIGDGGDWDNYVKATIAFLRKDKINFEKYGNLVQQNKPTIQRLKQNFNLNYEKAY